MSSYPHRIRIGRVTYERADDAPTPVAVERLGRDAEGRVLYGDPARANSRKHVFLAADDPPLVGYVRQDPPVGLSVVDVARAAFPRPLPRPDALALLGVLIAKHVVLIDGTRLGGSRDELADTVAAVALEPAGLAEHAARVPEWALVQAARPRWEPLSRMLLSVIWVRELADPDFGFVRSIQSHHLTVAHTSRDPVDVGDPLVVRSQDASHPDLIVSVINIEKRDVHAQPARAGEAQDVRPGDPVYFVPRTSTLEPPALGDPPAATAG